MGQGLLKGKLLLVGHLQHLRERSQARQQGFEGWRGDAGRLLDDAGLHIDEAGAGRDAIQRRDAADDEIADAGEPADLALTVR